MKRLRATHNILSTLAITFSFMAIVSIATYSEKAINVFSKASNSNINIVVTIDETDQSIVSIYTTDEVLIMDKETIVLKDDISLKINHTEVLPAFVVEKSFIIESFDPKTEYAESSISKKYLKYYFSISKSTLRNNPTVTMFKLNKPFKQLEVLDLATALSAQINTPSHTFIHKNTANRDQINTLDIAIISAGFENDNLAYKNLASNLASDLLKGHFFKDYLDRINIIRIDNKDSFSQLRCEFTSGLSDMKVRNCNNTDLIKRYENLVRADTSIVILNMKDIPYATAIFGGFASVSSSGIKSIKNIAAHEFGHSIGHLFDEYTLTATSHLDSTSHIGHNCKQTCNLASDISGCYEGCGQSSLYRSTDKSMMLSPYYPFDTFGYNTMKTILLKYAPDMGEKDKIAPNISIHYPPKDSNMSGVFTIKASAVDNKIVSKITLSLQNKIIQTCSSNICTLNFDSTKYQNGSYLILVNVYDHSSNAGSETLRFNIINDSVKKDIAPPTIKIISPAENNSISGALKINSYSWDNTRILNQVVYVDSDLAASCNSSLCILEIDSRKFSNGSHELRIEATDLEFNKTSKSIKININNAIGNASISDTSDIGLTVISPSNNAILNGTTLIATKIANKSKLLSQDIKIDGTTAKSCKDSECTYLFDTTMTNNGDHIITIKAIDTENNLSTKEVRVVVNNL